MPGQWEGSTRRATLPPDWDARRAYVLDRDGHRCTWVENDERCNSDATDCDHVNDRDDHSVENLRALCGAHHDRRTSEQGNAARWPTTQRRPVDVHPGLR